MVINMKIKNKNGISFDNTVYLMEENFRRFPIYMRLLQLLVVLLGGFSFISMFIYCFNLEFTESVLIIGIVVSGCVFFLLLLHSSYDYIKIVFACATYSGLIYKWFESLQNGFILMQNAIIERASSYYKFLGFQYVTDKATAIEDMTLLLIIIIIPVEALIVICLLRGKLMVLCYMAMIIPAVISFAMGITPRQVDMIVLIMVIMFLYLSKGFVYKAYGMSQKSLLYRVNIRSAIVVCLTVLFLFSFIKMFIPLEKYNGYDGIETAKSMIQGYIMDFSFPKDDIFDIDWNIKPRNFRGTGGLSNGMLGKVDNVTFNETEHLRVSLPLESVIEGMYLRGYVGSVYTGNKWEIHNKDTKKEFEKLKEGISLEEYEPAVGSSYILNKEPYNSYTKEVQVGITYRDIPKDYIYAPYFTSFDKEYGIRFDYDLATRSNKNKNQYIFDYRYGLSDLMKNGVELPSHDSSLQEYYDEEEKYRRFVYCFYTKLPETGLDRLRVDFSRQGVGKPSENLWDAITYIQEYLRTNTRYTLSPGKLPKGEDFVEYFLYENQLGYCSHYASAGVLMLRAMEYPARYVEGYSVSRSDLINSAYFFSDEFDNGDNVVDVSVKDSNAHAWAEVYIDGFGWIPVEFTPASGMGGLEDNFAGNNQFGQNGQVGENIEGTKDEPTIAPLQPPQNPKEENKHQEPPTQEDIEEDIKTEASTDNNKLASSFKWYQIAIPLLASIVLLLYVLRLSKKRKEYAQGNHSRRALYLYKRIEKLFNFSKWLPKNSRDLEESEAYVKEYLESISVNDFEDCMDTIRKARFGKEGISAAEYMVVEQFYDNVVKLVYERTTKVKRLYLKTIL